MWGERKKEKTRKQNSNGLQSSLIEYRPQTIRFVLVSADARRFEPSLSKQGFWVVMGSYIFSAKG